MDDTVCKKPTVHSWPPHCAPCLAKSVSFHREREGFVRAVLENILAETVCYGSDKVGKELAKASFLLLDALQSRTRYTMKRDKKRTAEYLHKMQKSERFDTRLYEKLIGSYELLLRRAQRNRRLLAGALEEIERFYMRHSFEALEDVLFLGHRSLAHIDIMISLHKEQMALYRSFLPND
ncbi:hypothetical protein [Hydrogenimonas sp.]